MEKGAFNPQEQEKDLSSKVVAGLERISEVFKLLLWEKAKLLGLSPIQIQILIFLAFHKAELCNVSHLAKEFNITKPTVSDAVKALHKKDLLIKDYSSTDNRSYTIALSDSGKDVLAQSHDFARPLKKQVDSLNQSELESLFGSLSKVIYQLNRSGVLRVQRTCYGCVFYQKNEGAHYCGLLQKDLLDSDIRLDCPEYKARANS